MKFVIKLPIPPIRLLTPYLHPIRLLTPYLHPRDLYK